MYNNTDYRSGDPQLIEFVRDKGKRSPKIGSNGKVQRDERGRVVMVREKGPPRGILVAGKVDGKVCIGWSYTHKKLDRFVKQRGMQIASNRMQMPLRIEKIPHKVMKQIRNNFQRRVENYFSVPLDLVF